MGKSYMSWLGEIELLLEKPKLKLISLLSVADQVLVYKPLLATWYQTLLLLSVMPPASLR